MRPAGAFFTASVCPAEVRVGLGCAGCMQSPEDLTFACIDFTNFELVKMCRYEFCWLCQGGWAEHGERTGGFYNCNRWARRCATNSCAFMHWAGHRRTAALPRSCSTIRLACMLTGIHSAWSNHEHDPPAEGLDDMSARHTAGMRWGRRRGSMTRNP